MSETVVVERVLHDGAVVVFRGRTGAGHAARFVAPRAATGRAPEPGEAWTVSGVWRTDPVYGRQVAVDRAVLRRPSGRLLVDALVHGKAFAGIGEVRARRLWEVFGQSVFGLLDAGDPAPFVAVLGEELAGVLVDGWRSMAADAAAFAFLVDHDFPPALGRKVLAVYGAVAVPEEHRSEADEIGVVPWHVTRDPYRMLCFASWPRVDRAARRMGVTQDDPRRLAAAVEAVLVARLKDGHTWQPDDVVHTDAARLLGGSGTGRAAVQHALAVAAVVERGGGLQLPGTAIMERFVEARCLEMVERRPGRGGTRRAVDVDALLGRFEAAEDYRLNGEQRSAVRMALDEPLSLLLGGPGVGKTTVLKAVATVLEASGRRVVQTALAGRAAQRMSEATGRPAWTLAGLLRRLDLREETLLDGPLVVVDEASMVDLSTFYRLLRRFGPRTNLLLVGDPGQLPPIGFGLVLHVLAENTAVPRTVLERVLRQTAASGIPAVCAAVREGRPPQLASATTAPGVAFVEVAEADVTERVVDLVLGGCATGAQVVGAVKRGAGGVRGINDRLHAAFAEGRRPCAAGLYEGEPVVVTRNDYELDVRNGELGRVVGSTSGAVLVRFDAREVAFRPEDLSKLELGYAVTCHRAQGSQFPTVVVPVTRNRLLDRTLLLTAISRAEERVVLVGDAAAFREAVEAAPGPSRRLVGFGR